MTENRRDYHRVNFYLKVIKIRPDSSEESVEGSIIDVSAKGISFTLKNNDKFSLVDQKFHLEFELEGEVFKREAELVRYERDEEKGVSLYAMQFIGDNDKERSTLYQVISKSEIKRFL